MNQTLIAVYQDGVLRPTTPPVALADGATVHVTLTVIHPGPSAAADPAEQARRAETVASLRQLDTTNNSDELPEGYDFLQALNDNRGAGERPRFAPETKGLAG